MRRRSVWRLIACNNFSHPYVLPTYIYWVFSHCSWTRGAMRAMWNPPLPGTTTSSSWRLSTPTSRATTTQICHISSRLVSSWKGYPFPVPVPSFFHALLRLAQLNVCPPLLIPSIPHVCPFSRMSSSAGSFIYSRPTLSFSMHCHIYRSIALSRVGTAVYFS